MDIRLFDAHAKLSIESTKRGLSIKLWQIENLADGHGWSLKSGILLSPEEIAALRDVLTPPEDETA